jgi:hypothetical protein
MMRSIEVCARMAVAIAAAVAPMSAYAEEASSGEAADALGDFGIGVRFGYLHGDTDGELQTPQGGNPGSSSSNRPKLDEIGVDDADAFDAAFDLSWRNHHLDLGGQWIELDGSATLHDPLVSRGLTFPSGTDVDADVQLDWYRVGYRYRFDIPIGSMQHLFVAPGVQGVYFDYDYHLDGGGQSVNRSFPQAGLRLGGTAEWQPHPFVSIEATGWWGVPIEETARILDVGLVGRLRVLHLEHGPDAWLHLGVGYERIEFRDEQDMANDIDVEIGPQLSAGIELRL